MGIREIRQRLVNLASGNKDIIRIILFGSFAKGNQTRQSDIDLIIVMNTDQPFFKRYSGLHRAVLDALKPFQVEFFIYTPDEFNNMLAGGNHFIARAIKEGKVMYERS